MPVFDKFRPLHRDFAASDTQSRLRRNGETFVDSVTRELGEKDLPIVGHSSTLRLKKLQESSGFKILLSRKFTSLLRRYYY